jgi:hypothetical protein
MSAIVHYHRNDVSVDARRAALRSLAEDLHRRVSRCELVTADALQRFFAAGRKALAPIEPPEAVRDRVLSAREAAA